MPRTSNRLNPASVPTSVPTKGRGGRKPKTPVQPLPKSENTSQGTPLPPVNQTSLTALKDVYLALHSEFSRLAADARTKLEHITNLEKVLGTSSSLTLSLPQFQSQAVAPIQSETVGILASSLASEVKDNGFDAVAASELAPDLPRPRGRRPKVKIEGEIKPVKRGRQPKVEGETPRKRGVLKLVKPYQDSTMLDALQLALEERKGSVVSADTLVEVLYGDQLRPDQYKLAKDRVTKSLSKGKIENRWDRVPDKIGCYTIAMKLLEL
ncbi:MAG: hypothetical protein SFT94_05775 [Pseudanabaenaceae cyanobacterium bins.68]|nr:hypothetical protein [Pseudanabaenaceae cyanobacterium bins.68]